MMKNRDKKILNYLLLLSKDLKNKALFKQIDIGRMIVNLQKIHKSVAQVMSHSFVEKIKSSLLLKIVD